MSRRTSVRKGSLEFTIRDNGPVVGEPKQLSNPKSWCWRLLANNGEYLHPLVKEGIGKGGIGVFDSTAMMARQRLWLACVLTLVFDSLDDHRVAPSQTAIADALNDAGVGKYKGAQWSRQDVNRMLSRYGLLERLGDYRYVNNLAWSQWLKERPSSGTLIRTGIYAGVAFAGKREVLKEMKEEAGVRTKEELLRHHGYIR